MDEKRRVYRLPPCPAYDAVGTAEWLQDMAARGLHLEQDGLFAGVAVFRRGAPRAVRYRPAASLEPVGLWSAGGGEPDPEAVALGAECAWEYVGRRGDFFLYRTEDPQARELHTDPAVEALAVRAVRRRRLSSLLQLVFWMAIYPAVLFRGGALQTVLRVGSGVALLSVALVLWLWAAALAEVVALGRRQRRLRAGVWETSRRRPARYFGRRAVQLALILVWVGLVLHGWNVSMSEENQRALADYDGTPPFATMADFVAGPADYEEEHRDRNGVEAWSDLLAPACIRWTEHARVTGADGRSVEGGLRLEYYRMRSARLADWLAREWVRTDLRQDDAAPLAVPDLADFAAAYTGTLHYPTVVLRQGNQVVRAYFYQLDGDPLSLETWAARLAASLSPSA